MSKVTLHKCDVCENIVDHVINVYANDCMYELCDNCYKDISLLEDMKYSHAVAISEINERIDKKVEEMINGRKEDII